MTDEPLTPEEQQSHAVLPRELPPPADLENRVVAALARGGHVRPARPAPRRWLRAAAAIVLVAAGIVIGRMTGAPRQAGGNDFLLLLYGSATASGRTEQELVSEYSAWADSLRSDGRLVAAERLAPEARVLGGDLSAAAQPVGFFLIRADTRDAAMAVAESCPHLKYGGSVVVKTAQ
jgi:hypothetical protein